MCRTVCVSISVFCFVSPSWLAACESKSPHRCFDLLKQYLSPSSSIPAPCQACRTDVVQSFLTVHKLKQPQVSVGGERRGVDGEKATTKLFFFWSYSGLDWLLWAWDSGCIAVCLICLEGFSLSERVTLISLKQNIPKSHSPCRD